MLFGHNTQRSARLPNHPVFKDIWDSCAQELRGKGFETEVYFVQGGVGVKLLNNDHPSIAQIAHLPISEFDFSEVSNPILAHLDFFNLNGLRLSKSPEIHFSELSSFSLRLIHADGSKANDFSALSRQPLEDLSLCHTNLRDLAFLKEAKLHSFYSANNPIDSINDLNLEELTVLDLFKCPISDLAPLGDSQIEELNLNATMVTDLSPLSGKPLRKLEMRATQVIDLSPLTDCPLEILHLPGSQIKSITPLSYLPLKEMNLIGLSIEDLSPLFTMPIEQLSISPNKLTNAQFELLREIKCNFLIGPGDPLDQTATRFFEKYENDIRGN
jgi:hypothetical protein